MAQITQLIEKPGGARNVVKWDLHIQRDFHPLYLLTGKREGYLDAERPVVSINVEFDDDASALEFEAKVRAMLPEVAPG
jgi:hypothetical protein